MTSTSAAIRVQPELDILQGDGLRRHVACLVRLVPALDLVLRRAGRGFEPGRREHGVIDVALLALELDAALELGGCGERRDGDAALQLADLQVVTQVCLESRLGATLLPQQRRIAIAGKLAIDLQRRDRPERVGELLVADR